MVGAHVQGNGGTAVAPKPSACPAQTERALQRLRQRPYPGLRPFRKEEWPIFRGRDRLIDDIVEILARTHFVSVIGLSGCGKSSLVRAGVLAALERRHGRINVRWRTGAMQPGATPLWYLAEAILRALRKDADLKKIAGLRVSLAAGRKNLATVVSEHGLKNNENLLLLVDQFEELFRYTSGEEDEERARFIELLLGVARSKPAGLHVITTMRSDYLGECARFRGLAEILNQTQYLVPWMSAEELREAIIEPAKRRNGRVEAALVDRLIDDVECQGDQLPILQHTLLWMWSQEEERRDKLGLDAEVDIHLRLADYEKLGAGGDARKRVKNALSRHGDRILDRLSPKQRWVAEVMFRRMMEVEEHSNRLRRPTRSSTVAKLARASPAVVERVVDAFRDEDASFISADRRGDETSIDIMHESVIRQWDVLNDWRRREQRSCEIYYDVCRAQRRMREGTGGLLVGLDLSRAWNWYDKERPTSLWARRYDKSFDGDFDAAIDFLKKSQEAKAKADEEEERKRKEELERAEAQATRFLALRGRAALERVGPTRALLIALEGLTRKQLRHVPETEALAYEALQQLRERRIIHAPIGQSSIEFSPRDRTVLLTAGADGCVRLWNATEGRQLAKRSIARSGYIRARWDLDGERVLAGTLTGKAYVLPMRSGKRGVQRLGRPVEFGDSSHQAGPGVFSPDGRLILTGSMALEPVVWDSATLPPKFVWRGAGSGLALAFSANGERFATAGNDCIIRVYLTQTRELLKEQTYTSPIMSLSFHPTNEHLLLATTLGGGAFLWDTRHPRSKTVRHDKGLRFLRYEPGKIHRGFSFQGTFSRDGTLVATAAEDAVRLWHMADFEAPIVLSGHAGNVFSLGFEPDGKAIASASSDATLRIWSIEPALQTDRKKAGPPHDAEPSSEGSEILAREGGRELVWDASTSPPALRVRGWRRPVSLGHLRGIAKPAAAAIAPHANFVLVAPSEPGRPLLYDLESPEAPVAVLGETDAKWRSVAFVPGPGRPMGVTATGERHAWTYFPERAELIAFARRHLPQEHGAPVRLSEDELGQLGLAPP